MNNHQSLMEAAQNLRDAVDQLTFAEPVTHVYNPLKYAWEAHQQYLQMVDPKGCRVLFLGMNPGPWGMAQTGVPFGQIEAVRDWLKIDAPIGRPEHEHPKRPIEGLDCSKSEVSGQRLWGLFREKFPDAKAFFRKHFVANYCPLVFMEQSARNRTPDKLPVSEKSALDAVCDQHLRDVLAILQPKVAVGVGAYAEKCFQRVLDGTSGERPQVVRILHPSPASPAANRGWAEQATRQLQEAEVW